MGSEFRKSLPFLLTCGFLASLVSCGKQVLPFEGKTLASGQVGVEYQCSIANGDKDMYYDLDYSSNLPKGLILYDDGTIKGVPRESGAFAFKAVMIDLRDVEYYADFSLTIAGGKIEYSSFALPSGKQNEPYEQSLARATGMSDITYTVVGGELPQGMTLTADGILSGIPTVYGEFHFTVSAGAEGADFATAEFTLTLVKGEKQNTDEGRILFEDFVLPNGEVGKAYSESIRKAYGVPDISYTIRFSSGAGLPSGMSANKDLGIISGTPTDSTEGPITFRVIASAPGYDSVTAKVTLTVQDPYITTTRFETEYVDTIPHLSGAGYSSAPSGRGMIQKTPKCSNGHVLGYLNKPVEIKYTISSSSDTTATMTLGLGSDNGTITYDTDMFSISVNGTEVLYSDFTFQQVGETEATYEATAVTIDKTVSLVKGTNTIVFQIKETPKATGTFSAVGCLFDYMDLTGANGDIGWRPRKGNVSA